jgi:hypothetical protein
MDRRDRCLLCYRRGLIPSFWVKLDIPKRLGGNEKRFGCPHLNLTPNRIMQTRRYIRLLALRSSETCFQATTIGLMIVAVFLVGIGIGDILSKSKQANTNYAAVISRIAEALQ